MSVTLLPDKRIVLVALFLSPLPALAAPVRLQGGDDSARYRVCLDAVHTNPTAALADAAQWGKSGGGVPADHCAALALVGLKRYAEAATRLDTVAGARAVPDASFRASLFDQAGNAWLLAGDGSRAAASFSSALALSGGDADLFADLARANAMRRNWHEVDLDLNAALQMNPRRADLLILRASARRALKRYADASGDIEAALKLRPGDADALVERGQLRRQVGDLGGARRDFQAALHAAPQGEAAETAKENLEALTAP